MGFGPPVRTDPFFIVLGEISGCCPTVRTGTNFAALIFCGLHITCAPIIYFQRRIPIPQKFYNIFFSDGSFSLRSFKKQTFFFRQKGRTEHTRYKNNTVSSSVSASKHASDRSTRSQFTFPSLHPLKSPFSLWTTLSLNPILRQLQTHGTIEVSISSSSFSAQTFFICATLPLVRTRRIQPSAPLARGIFNTSNHKLVLLLLLLLQTPFHVIQPPLTHVRFITAGLRAIEELHFHTLSFLVAPS